MFLRLSVQGTKRAGLIVTGTKGRGTNNQGTSLEKPRNDFKFCQLFAEIFIYFRTSPVSTPMKNHTLIL
jgi:hypothetical protein